jgi:hypothetical protein
VNAELKGHLCIRRVSRESDGVSRTAARSVGYEPDYPAERNLKVDAGLRQARRFIQRMLDAVKVG